MTSQSNQNTSDVLLIHGIMMRPVVMYFLGKKLEKAGFRVHYARFHTIRQTSAQNAAQIHLQILALGVSRLHIVAHSLGGLITMHLLAQFDDVPEGNVIMLGSPVAGSLLAQTLRRWPFAGLLLAKSLHGALSGMDIPGWKAEKHRWFMIAGNKNRGLGWMVGGLPEQGDGTVMVNETRHEAQSGHLVLPVSHTGMLFSEAVAKEVVRYLLH